MTKHTKPLVSILLPMYNAESYIRDCIKSILSQTYENLDILVMDDGSEDNSVPIVTDFNDKRLKVIKCKHNYIETLNYGLKLCKGKYIARMDADDIMFENRIEEQVSIMEKDETISFCSSQMLVIGTDYITNEGLKGKLCNYRLMLLLGNYIAHPTVMIRTGFLKGQNLRYSSDYPYAEDYKMWTDIASKGGSLYVIPKPLINYRISNQQVSQRHVDKQMESALVIKTELLNQLISEAKSENKEHLIRLLDTMIYFNERDFIQEDVIFEVFYKVLSNIEYNGTL